MGSWQKSWLLVRLYDFNFLVHNILKEQPGHIYYKLYNILYGSEKHTISIKVGKIYYINGKIDLCYIKRYTTMDILYKVMFSTLPSTHSGVWYYILKDNGINVLQNLGISFDHTIHGPELVTCQHFISTLRTFVLQLL